MRRDWSTLDRSNCQHHRMVLRRHLSPVVSLWSVSCLQMPAINLTALAALVGLQKLGMKRHFIGQRTTPRGDSISGTTWQTETWSITAEGWKPKRPGTTYEPSWAQPEWGWSGGGYHHHRNTCETMNSANCALKRYCQDVIFDCIYRMYKINRPFKAGA